MNSIKLIARCNDKGREQVIINPEFAGIGIQFTQTHYKRRSIQLQEIQATNRVSYLQKQHQFASKKNFKKKENDLEKFMVLVYRKKADDGEREMLRKYMEKILAQLRQQNMRLLQQRQLNMSKAHLSLFDENRYASETIRKTINHYENIRQSLRQDNLKAKRVYYRLLDIFTHNYKYKINRERDTANNASVQLQYLSAVEKELRLKLENSSAKLNEIQQRYDQAYQYSNKSPFSVYLSRSFFINNRHTGLKNEGNQQKLAQQQ